jgi:hypothetical protein
MKDEEEMMAMLANDLFSKRQRLIAASRLDAHMYDNRSAKAAFARAMKPDRRVA